MKNEMPIAGWRDLTVLTERIVAGDIPANKTRANIVAWFHLHVGGPLRAIREVDPETARDILQHIRTMLEDIEGTPATRPSKGTARQGSTHDARSPRVLRRERIILRFLLDSNKPVNLALLMRKINESESISSESLVAHLHRLIAAGVIQKKRKGVYASNESTEAWLSSLPVDTAEGE